MVTLMLTLSPYPIAIPIEPKMAKIYRAGIIPGIRKIHSYMVQVLVEKTTASRGSSLVSVATIDDLL